MGNSSLEFDAAGRDDHGENMEGFGEDYDYGKYPGSYDLDYRPDYKEYEGYFYYQSFGFERVVYLYVWEIMVLLTTITNILVLLVLTRKSQRNATNVILIAVAVSDSLTGLSTLPTYMYAFTHYERNDLKLTEGWCEAFMISKLFVSKSFHTMSIWFTLCLVAQRYISVKWPFKAQTIFTIPKTLIMITIVAVLSPILHIYHLQNKKALQLKCAWELKNPCKEDCAYLWATFFMMHFIPCTLIVILTVLMIHKMSQTEERLQESQLISNQKILKRRAAQNRRISVIVIIVVIIFLIPEIPYGVFLLISVSLKHSGKELMDLDKNRAFHCAYEILLVLNFHANFWVYIAMNRKFRSGLKRTFIPCLAVMFRCLRICGIHKHIQRTPSVSSSSEIKLEQEHATRTTMTSVFSQSVRSNQSDLEMKTYRTNSLKQPENHALQEVPNNEANLEEKTYKFNNSNKTAYQTGVPDDGENKLNKVENIKRPVYKTEYVVKLDNTQKSNSQLANTSFEIKLNHQQEVKENDTNNGYTKQTTNEGDIADKSAETRNENLTAEDALVTSRKLETRLSTSSSSSSSNIQ